MTTKTRKASESRQSRSPSSADRSGSLSSVKKSESLSPINGKVWRFVDYEARWGCTEVEIPKYIKWYINAWQGCEGDVASALNQLRADPDFIWLQGALLELLSRATNTGRPYQGYILTAAHEPATSLDVGRILRTKGRGRSRGAAAVLRKFEATGFLEFVDLASLSPKAGKKLKRLRKQRKTTERAPPDKKQRKRAKKAGSKTAKAPGLLKGEEKSKVAAQKEKTRSAQDKIQAQKRLCNEQIKQIIAEKPARTAASPTSSTKSDGPGRARQMPAPADRMPAPPSSTPRLGDVIRLNAHRYNPAAWLFADELLIRVGYLTCTQVDHVRQGAESFTPDQECERAHWAKAWDLAQGVFAGDSLAWLRDGIFKRADTVRANRARYKNPESYVMTSWNNLVRDLKRKGKAKIV